VQYWAWVRGLGFATDRIPVLDEARRAKKPPQRRQTDMDRFKPHLERAGQIGQNLEFVDGSSGTSARSAALCPVGAMQASS